MRGMMQPSFTCSLNPLPEEICEVWRADAPNLTKGRSMSASSGIWSLVSGFPGQKRGNRLLAMFQAYLDESTSNPVHEGVFVMAGWISTAEKWAVFSDEWQEA